MATTVTYANWWSRLFFRESFERQFVIPIEPPSWTRRALEAIEATRFPARLMADRPVDRPIFIVGLPRSGTTMLFNLLCSHEQAAYFTNSMSAYPTAINTIEWLRKRFDLDVRGERYLHDSLEIAFGGPAELMTHWGRWTGRTAESLDWESDPLPIGEALRARVRLDFQRALHAFGPRAQRVIAKDPVIQPDLLALQAIFPDARFVHIVRDGRMVANSLVKLHRLNNQQLARIRHPAMQSIVTYPRIRRLKAHIEAHGVDTLECTARVWEETVQLVRDTAPRLNHFYELRYEDLLAAPERELPRLLAFCELPSPAPDNAAFARECAGIGQIRHQNHYGGFEVVERVAARTLAQYGYLPAAADASP